MTASKFLTERNIHKNSNATQWKTYEQTQAHQVSVFIKCIHNKTKKHAYVSAPHSQNFKFKHPNMWHGIIPLKSGEVSWGPWHVALVVMIWRGFIKVSCAWILCIILHIQDRNLNQHHCSILGHIYLKDNLRERERERKLFNLSILRKCTDLQNPN